MFSDKSSGLKVKKKNKNQCALCVAVQEVRMRRAEDKVVKENSLVISNFLLFSFWCFPQLIWKPKSKIWMQDFYLLWESFNLFFFLPVCTWRISVLFLPPLNKTDTWSEFYLHVWKYKLCRFCTNLFCLSLSTKHLVKSLNSSTSEREERGESTKSICVLMKTTKLYASLSLT